VSRRAKSAASSSRSHTLRHATAGRGLVAAREHDDLIAVPTGGGQARIEPANAQLAQQGEQHQFADRRRVCRRQPRDRRHRDRDRHVAAVLAVVHRLLGRQRRLLPQFSHGCQTTEAMAPGGETAARLVDQADLFAGEHAIESTRGRRLLEGRDGILAAQRHDRRDLRLAFRGATPRHAAVERARVAAEPAAHAALARVLVRMHQFVHEQRQQAAGQGLVDRVCRRRQLHEHLADRVVVGGQPARHAGERLLPQRLRRARGRQAERREQRVLHHERIRRQEQLLLRLEVGDHLLAAALFGPHRGGHVVADRGQSLRRVGEQRFAGGLGVLGAHRADGNGADQRRLEDGSHPRKSQAALPACPIRGVSAGSG
jgi:hypothetical protein